MTRAEYLEAVEESFYFADAPPLSRGYATSEGIIAAGGDGVLRDTPEVCAALKLAHEEYCNRVANILGVSREHTEDRPHDPTS